MKDLAINGEKRMTVKEVAAALGVDASTVRKHIKDIRIDLGNVSQVENGKTTYMTESEVFEIKRRIERSGRNDLGNVVQVSNITTDLEMKEKAVEVMAWLVSQVEDTRKKLAESERRNAVLMHVSKTYTATEVAKELGFRSAMALNEELEKHGVQFKQNGTWVPRAEYSELGYFQIKQEVLDSGRVVYYTRITQDGRRFILDLLADMFRE